MMSIPAVDTVQHIRFHSVNAVRRKLFVQNIWTCAMTVTIVLKPELTNDQCGCSEGEPTPHTHTIYRWYGRGRIVMGNFICGDETKFGFHRYETRANFVARISVKEAKSKHKCQKPDGIISPTLQSRIRARLFDHVGRRISYHFLGAFLSFLRAYV